MKLTRRKMMKDRKINTNTFITIHDIDVNNNVKNLYAGANGGERSEPFPNSGAGPAFLYYFQAFPFTKISVFEKLDLFQRRYP